MKGSCPVAPHETKQVVGADRGGCFIGQGVRVDPVVLHQRFVHDELHPALHVVDQPESRHRAGITPSRSISASGLPKDTRLAAPITW